MPKPIAITDFKKPPARFLRSAKVMAKWHDLYFSPEFVHEDRIPANNSRLLFVGFHTLMGYDFPYMWYRLYRDHGLLLRALTDKYIFAAPGAGQALANTMGHIEGTRENCRVLMEAGHTLAVYPGGSKEALHAKNNAHQMDWGNRNGFARMALEYGYTMIPFAAVGIDDQWDYLVDGQEFAHSTFGKYLKKIGLINRDDLFPPLFKSMWPRPNRHFYGFGNPIETPVTPVDKQTDELVEKYRQLAYEGVDGLLKELVDKRDTTPDKRLLAPFTKER